MSEKKDLKERTQAALRRAGLTQAELARKAGVRQYAVEHALYSRLAAEPAGKITRALGDALSLGSEDRRALFTEIMNFPGETRDISSRVATESVMQRFKDSLEER
jgi:transcriptional regulator with XRE-family HTH domain